MSPESKEDKKPSDNTMVVNYINEKTPPQPTSTDGKAVSQSKDHTRTMLVNTPLAAEEDDSLEGDPGGSRVMGGSGDTLPLTDNNQHSDDTSDIRMNLLGDGKDPDNYTALIDQFGPVNEADEPDGVHVGSRAGENDWGVQEKVDWYQRKKLIAQGMMDLALFSANANQLRYVLESNSTHPYYYFSLVLISLSIILQVVVGIAMVLHSQCDMNDSDQKDKAHKANDATVLGVFLITVINVFISSFSVSTASGVAPVNP